MSVHLLVQPSQRNFKILDYFTRFKSLYKRLLVILTLRYFSSRLKTYPAQLYHVMFLLFPLIVLFLIGLKFVFGTFLTRQDD